MGNAAAHEPLGRASSALAVRSSHRRSKRRHHAAPAAGLPDPGAVPGAAPAAAANVEGQGGGQGGGGEKARSPNNRRMDRFRRSFRDSFRRRKEPSLPESSKPHQWQLDEAAVRAGTCCFHVKYMGCVEVFESRGMQVCEEALKVLRNSRRRRVRAILYVSGDGLRVVEDETKGLIVDQTIEKVSFCAPDRNHDKGFSYICRDGTTRRWMCHGFLALRESGERLSHAVGCAFAACLERKQRRDKDFGVTMKFDPKDSTFTRSGSFRQPSLTERLADPQELKPAEPVAPAPPHKAGNPFAIERPHATVSMLQRQGSFRGFSQLNQASPFKRQLSLRIGDLPSNLERQRSLSLASESSRPQVSPIPESSPLSSRSGTTTTPSASPAPAPALPPADPVSAMCQQLSQGLQLLSLTDEFSLDSMTSKNNNNNNSLSSANGLWTGPVKAASVDQVAKDPLAWTSTSLWPRSDGAPSSASSTSPAPPTPPAPPAPSESPAPAAPAAPTIVPVPPKDLPRPEQWLGKIATVVKPAAPAPASPVPTPRRPGMLGSHSRAYSLGSAESYMGVASMNANGHHGTAATDPFNADWAVPPHAHAQVSTALHNPGHAMSHAHAHAHGQPGAPASSTNPFLGNPVTVKAFEVRM